MLKDELMPSCCSMCPAFTCSTHTQAPSETAHQGGVSQTWPRSGTQLRSSSCLPRPSGVFSHDEDQGWSLRFCPLLGQIDNLSKRASIYFYIEQKYFTAEAEKQIPMPHLFLSNLVSCVLQDKTLLMPKGILLAFHWPFSL